MSTLVDTSSQDRPPIVGRESASPLSPRMDSPDILPLRRSDGTAQATPRSANAKAGAAPPFRSCSWAHLPAHPATLRNAYFLQRGGREASSCQNFQDRIDGPDQKLSSNIRRPEDTLSPAWIGCFSREPPASSRMDQPFAGVPGRLFPTQTWSPVAFPWRSVDGARVNEPFLNMVIDA